MLARNWGQLIEAVAGSRAHRDAGASLSLAMSLGSAITADGLACSVTQITHAGYHTPVWSNQIALDLDRAQYAAGTGPCVDTAHDGRAHTIKVMADESRYPAFSAAAIHRGVRCSLSLPLPDQDRPGALNLYARTTSAYDSHRTRATAELLARCVGALLAEHTDTKPGLDAAMDQRVLIERAQAELVEQGAADGSAAYVRMTQLSRRGNRSIFAVAQDVVDDGARARHGTQAGRR